MYELLSFVTSCILLVLMLTLFIAHLSINTLQLGSILELAMTLGSAFLVWQTFKELRSCL